MSKAAQKSLDQAQASLSAARACLNDAKSDLIKLQSMEDLLDEKNPQVIEDTQKLIETKTAAVQQAESEVIELGKDFYKKFWVDLADQKKNEYGPFLALNLHRGRGEPEYTGPIRTARLARIKNPKSPWHWLEFYNRLLDSFTAHQCGQKSILSDDTTNNIPINQGVLDELNLLQRMYRVCLVETTQDEPEADTEADLLRRYFIAGISRFNKRITGNQYDFLVPVIFAHFIWALKESDISIDQFHVLVREERMRSLKEKVAVERLSIAHSIIQYATSFMRHVSSYVRFTSGGDEGFLRALIFLAGQDERSSDNCYIEWNNHASNNVDIIRRVAQGEKIPAIKKAAPKKKVVSTVQKRKPKENKQAPVVRHAEPQKSAEERQETHRHFWAKMAGKKNPFTSLCQAKIGSDIKEKKSYLEASRIGRGNRSNLVFSFLEVYEKILQALIASVDGGRPLLDKSTTEVVFNDQTPSDGVSDANVLWRMFFAASGVPLKESKLTSQVRDLKSILHAGMKQVFRKIENEDRRELFAVLATAQLLLRFRKEAIDLVDVLGCLGDKDIEKCLMQYARNFSVTVYDFIIKADNSYPDDSRMVVFLSGRHASSSDLYTNWVDSKWENVHQINKYFSKQQVEQARLEAEKAEQEQEKEESVFELEWGETGVPSAQLTQQGQNAVENQQPAATQALSVKLELTKEQQFFQDLIVKQKPYWIPARIAVAICFPPAAIWLLIEWCLHEAVMRRRQEEVDQKTINITWPGKSKQGLVQESAFKAHRHLGSWFLEKMFCCQKETQSMLEWSNRNAMRSE